MRRRVWRLGAFDTVGSALIQLIVTGQLIKLGAGPAGNTTDIGGPRQYMRANRRRQQQKENGDQGTGETVMA